MQYFRIEYYRKRNWIDYKIVKTEIGATDAIKKTRLKEIVDVIELTVEQYNYYMGLKKAQKESERAYRDSFILS